MPSRRSSPGVVVRTIGRSSPGARWPTGRLSQTDRAVARACYEEFRLSQLRRQVFGQK
jgi:hypothetical protein